LEPKPSETARGQRGHVTKYQQKKLNKGEVIRRPLKTDRRHTQGKLAAPRKARKEAKGGNLRKRERKNPCSFESQPRRGRKKEGSRGARMKKEQGSQRTLVPVHVKANKENTSRARLPAGGEK